MRWSPFQLKSENRQTVGDYEPWTRRQISLNHRNSLCYWLRGQIYRQPGYAFRCIVVLNGPPALYTFLVTSRLSIQPYPTPSSVLRNLPSPPPVPPLSRITVPELRHCSGLFGDLWILLPPTNFHGPLFFLPFAATDALSSPSPSCLPQDLSNVFFRDILAIFRCLKFWERYWETCHVFNWKFKQCYIWRVRIEIILFELSFFIICENFILHKYLAV